MPPKNAPDAPPPHPCASPAVKASNELLFKSILLLLIGLAVLVGPAFMAPSGMRDMVASSAVVGWFALVLGGAFGVLYGLRRRSRGRLW